MLHSNALFLWRQEDTSSLRLLSDDRSGRQIIKNFSLQPRSQGLSSSRPSLQSSVIYQATVKRNDNRELKIETFSGRRQLQPDVTSSFVGYCACSCSPPCRRGPVGDVKLGCLALWRKREYLTFISIRFVAFSNQHFADYRS